MLGVQECSQLPSVDWAVEQIRQEFKKNQYSEEINFDEIYQSFSLRQLQLGGTLHATLDRIISNIGHWVSLA